MTIERKFISGALFGAVAVLLLSVIFLTRPLAMFGVHAAAASTPVSPEMQRLTKLYSGTWDYIEVYDKSSFHTEGGKNTGIYSSEPGPGGNSIVNKFHSHGPIGEYEGMLVMTWAPKENAYKAYVFASDFPGAFVETGHFDGDTLTFTGEVSMGSTKLALRNSTHPDDQGRLISEEFSSVNGAPETRLIVATATRKP